MSCMIELMALTQKIEFIQFLLYFFAIKPILMVFLSILCILSSFMLK